MFKLNRFSIILCLLIFSINLNIFAATKKELLLVPQPRSITLRSDNFNFNNRGTVIRINEQAEQDDQFSAQMLKEEIRTDLGIDVPVGAESGYQTIHIAIYAQDLEIQRLCKNRRIVLSEELGREGYVLSVRNQEIIVTSLTSTGLFYGVQTLRQLIRGNSERNRIPGVMIRDYPALAFRGVQDDISRGPVPTLSFLKSEIRRYSELKINYFTLYTEHVFKTKSHPDFAPPGGSLTAEDIRELVKYGEKYHVELIGNFQSFGHFSHILKHPRYEHLGEKEWLLSPAFKESYELLSDILKEIVPVYNSRYFNVNCDETWGLGDGASQKQVEKKGVAGVYADHLNWLDQTLKKENKQMLMWADIALKHPDILSKLPVDIVMLTWDYSARESFVNSIQPLRDRGFNVIVCPGISCWNRMFPDFETAKMNIRNFVRDGVNGGAMGMLNTTWDDDGENLFSWNWYGIAYGADQSWYPGATDDASFNRRFSGAVYGDTENLVAQIIDKLSAMHQLSAGDGFSNSQFWEPVFPKWGQTRYVKIADWQPILKKTTGIDSLLRLSHPEHYSADLDYLKFVNQRYQLFYKLRKKTIYAAENYRKACLNQIDPDETALFLRIAWFALSQNYQDLLNLQQSYKQLWMAENRIYWLDRNMEKYEHLLAELSDTITRLEQAIMRFEQGLPLPAPKEVRLGALELKGTFLENWLISNAFPNENNEGFSKDYLTEIGGEATAAPKPAYGDTFGKGASGLWQVTTSVTPFIDLATPFKNAVNKVAYAFATLNSTYSREVQLSVGSDDGIKIFLNGQVVHQNPVFRSHRLDSELVSVRLKQGSNHLMVKITQGDGAWGFSIRLIGAEVAPGSDGSYVVE